MFVRYRDFTTFVQTSPLFRRNSQLLRRFTRMSWVKRRVALVFFVGVLKQINKFTKSNLISICTIFLYQISAFPKIYVNLFTIKFESD